ncbi:MAG: hypothetical protein JST82_13095 [Bacteroidetes bacterium]|nr:hypothetical protein [Bacteroidota bacterium]
MNEGAVSVQQAIRKGSRAVSLPLWLGLPISVCLCIVLMKLDFSFRYLWLIPIGMVLSLIFSSWAGARWRLWAYEHVADIHQLQRSAELAGLLRMQSYNKLSIFLSGKQRARLKELEQRFNEPAVFYDDPHIPAETIIKVSGRMTANGRSQFILNDKGITYQPDGLVPWNNIYNDRIAIIGYKSRSYRTAGETSGGYGVLFRFETNNERNEIPLASLNIDIWVLDLLLYTYRGRYNKQHE